jgi:hypothetical protein
MTGHLRIAAEMVSFSKAGKSNSVHSRQSEKEHLLASRGSPDRGAKHAGPTT